MEKALLTEYRYPLEMIESGFSLPLNPSEVHDHSSTYIYRILHTKPVSVTVTFVANGLSYVEVFDADNERFLLAEKTEISETTNFTIEWDGRGVLEPRVWKDSNVSAIMVEFDIPDTEKVFAQAGVYDWSNVLATVGIGVLGAGVLNKLIKKKKVKK